MITVKIIKTGVVADYDNYYAIRLIEQGKAVLADGTPTTEPVSIPAAAQEPKDTVTDDGVFAAMSHTITQAKERQLEESTALMQEEVEAMGGA